VRDAWIFSRLILDPTRGAWTSWNGGYHGKLSNGRFEIGGLGPDAEVPVYFLEPERKLGTVVNLSVRPKFQEANQGNSVLGNGLRQSPLPVSGYNFSNRRAWACNASASVT
jgi:hypothetical protein